MIFILKKIEFSISRGMNGFSYCCVPGGAQNKLKNKFVTQILKNGNDN